DGECVQPIEPRHKSAQVFKVVNDHGQCAQYGRKRAGSLDGATDFELARKHARSDNGAGQHDGQEAIAILKQIQIQLPVDEFVEVATHLFKTPPHMKRLPGFTPIERNRLSVLTNSDQAESKIRLPL